MENSRVNSLAPDPYYVARDAVNQTVTHVKAAYKEWETSLHKQQGKQPQFSETTRRILEDIEHLEEDVSVIDTSIKAVELNPTRFQLKAGELELRKEWLKIQRTFCFDIRSKISGDEVKAKIESGKRAAELARSDEARKARTAEQSHTATIRESKEVQQQIIATQDETLTELARVTDRLGQTAVVINTELQDQQRLLNELGEDIDRQQEKMNYVMGKMSRLLKTSDTKQLIFVLILMCIATVLFLMNVSV